MEAQMALNLPSKNWWETDTYEDSSLLGPLAQSDVWGPKGPALVRAYLNGSTQPGWGRVAEDGSLSFIPRYLRGEFSYRAVEYAFKKRQSAAAIVTRSGRIVCVDIDGKNGGLSTVTQLGALPYTTAETSKSGNGYHLFYSVPEDSWSAEGGFEMIPDQIGIVKGVDIRGIGCVYHYPTQRWNDRPLTDAPPWLIDRLTKRKKQRELTQSIIIDTLDTLDPEEILIMQDELLEELNKTIPAGNRNNTLFAIGSKLMLAQIDGWDDLIRHRAKELNLDFDETERIVRNIGRYAK